MATLVSRLAMAAWLMVVCGLLTAAEAETNVSIARRALVQRDEVCEDGPTAHVKLCIKTDAGWWDGGTDADVHVSFVGTLGCRSPWVNLDSPRDDFEQGKYDCFEYHTPSVGYSVWKILVKQARNAERWCLNFVDLCLYEGSCCNQMPRRYKGPMCYKGDGVKDLTIEYPKDITWCSHASTIHVLQNFAQTLSFVLLAQKVFWFPF